MTSRTLISRTLLWRIGELLWRTEDKMEDDEKTLSGLLEDD